MQNVVGVQAEQQYAHVDGSMQAERTMLEKTMQPRNIIDTRPKAACKQRPFCNTYAHAPLIVDEPVLDTDMTDTPSSPATCQREIYLFAACGHACIAPPCTCWTPLADQAPFSSPFPAVVSLNAFPSPPFKQIKFKPQCPACQILTLDFQLEIAKQNYEDNLELWGDEGEDTIKDVKLYGKAGLTYERLTKTTYRDSPNVRGWEQVYVGAVCGARGKWSLRVLSLIHI